MELKATLDDIFQDVTGRFTYVPDQFQFGEIEYWMEPELLDGDFSGDCDDFALACRKLVRKAGLPSRLVFCQIETGEYHLVLESEGWILDNRQKFVVSNAKLRGRSEWISMSGFNAGGPWTHIKPLQD